MFRVKLRRLLEGRQLRIVVLVSQSGEERNQPNQRWRSFDKQVVEVLHQRLGGTCCSDACRWLRINAVP
jgi:hypothetical protein